MRLPRNYASTALAAGNTEGLPAGAPGLPDNPLLGSWSATRWQYARGDDSGQVLDLVCDLGGTITLSLSDGTWVLAYDVAGRAKQSVGGTWVARQDVLELSAAGADAAEAVRFRVSTETLSLSSLESWWDFDNSGQDVPALFVAVFVRL